MVATSTNTPATPTITRQYGVYALSGVWEIVNATSARAALEAWYQLPGQRRYGIPRIVKVIATGELIEFPA